jgi:hypothetical protein
MYVLRIAAIDSTQVLPFSNVDASRASADDFLSSLASSGFNCPLYGERPVVVGLLKPLYKAWTGRCVALASSARLSVPGIRTHHSPAEGRCTVSYAPKLAWHPYIPHPPRETPLKHFPPQLLVSVSVSGVRGLANLGIAYTAAPFYQPSSLPRAPFQPETP